jgi:hypothetical protein
MALSRDLLRDLRRLDEFDLRRLMIIVRGLLLERGGSLVVEQPPGVGAVTYRRQPVTCSKPGCTRCPHGPYWYAYWREDGKQRSRYIGKALPDDAPTQA